MSDDEIPEELEAVEETLERHKDRIPDEVAAHIEDALEQAAESNDEPIESELPEGVNVIDEERFR